MGEREKDIEPISFINQPLRNIKQDAFHMKIQVQELEKAVKDGANFIGIFSEYGGGKSSIVQNYARKHLYRVCNICLWNYEGATKSNESNGISSFTLSFLYQFSKVVGGGFPHHINRMMSRNYKQLSFSTDFGGMKKALIVVCLTVFFVLMSVGKYWSLQRQSEENQAATATELGNAEVDQSVARSESELTGIEQNTVKIYRYVVELCNDKLVVIPAIGIALLLLFVNNSVLISWKDDDISRELGEADAYEIFDKIVSAVRKKVWSRIFQRRCVLNIEDLDRVTDKNEVYEFLKELYKYNNLLSKQGKNKFIFIVSLSMKSYIEVQDENITDKLFDYKMVLRPCDPEKRTELFSRVIEKWEGNINSRVSSKNADWKKWAVQGENMQIRDIKSRINTALVIYNELYAEGEKRENIDFEKCVIAAYLESVYPKDVYILISRIACWGNCADMKKEINDNWEFSSKFKKDMNQLIDDKKFVTKGDWKYFYRHPRK